MKIDTGLIRDSDEILIVEDSPTQAEKLKYILEKNNFKITVAENGDKALSRLKEVTPLLIISDIMMPGMNGYELCRRIKSDKRTGEIPVILLTSLAGSEDVLEGLACGADNFLTKPYNEEYLLLMVSKILAGGKIRKTENVRIGVEVTISGKRRFITADQQQMLSMLISTYEAAVHRNTELIRVQDELRLLNEELEQRVEERTSELLREVAERRRGEDRERRLNDILRKIRGINELITKEKDRNVLIDEACAILTSTRGFKSVCIALTDREGKLLNFSWKGLNENRQFMMEPMSAAKWPSCIEKAIEETGIVVIEDVSSFCGACRLSEGSERHSAFAARLEHGGNHYGFMVVSLPENIDTGEEEQGLFKEIVGDIAFALYNIDLGERRLGMERELKDSETRYRALFEGAAEGILITENRTGKFRYANSAVCQMLGYTEEELRDMSAKDIHSNKALDRIVSEFKASQHENIPIMQQDIACITKDGKKIYADIVTTPTIIIDGSPHSAAFFLDTTKRKKAEDEKRKLEEQLWQAQKLEAIGRLSGGIAHDFNNMLTTIIGNAEMALLEMGEGDDLKEVVEDIKFAGEKAAVLTRQLLAFSRRQILQPEIVNLNDIVFEMDKMLRRLIGEDIELETRLAPGLGFVEVDPGQVEQIVMNLAVNARDAMPEGGKLTIETADIELDEGYASTHFPVIPGRYEMISVSDTGSGMTKEVREQIFEPFYTTKEKGKGTGLGLSIVYGIVKQSNGYIWAYSEPGKGAAFKIYLPRIEEEDSKEEDVKKGENEAIGGDETILAVEDDKMIMKVIMQTLKKSGYNVLCAGDGNEALRISEEYKGPIHLMLSDVIMPGMGGRELASRLEEKRPDMKVLYMSGYTDNAIVHHGVLEKGLSFIQKPFSSNNLRIKIRETLEDRRHN